MRLRGAKSEQSQAAKKRPVYTSFPAAPPGTQAGFYRTAGGAEADLVLALAPARLWAIDIKRSLAPKPERGFREACADLGAGKRLMVYPGEERFSVGPGMEAIGVTELMHELRRSRR